MNTSIIYQQNNILVEQSMKEVVVTNGEIRLVYQMESGKSDIYRQPDLSPVLSGLYAEVLKDGKVIKNCELKRDISSAISVMKVSNNFGQGIKVTIRNSTEEYEVLQNYYCYMEKMYLLMETELCSQKEVCTNYMAVMRAEGIKILQMCGNDVKFLSIPYDNDSYVRYSAHSPETLNESYEVAAIYDNETRRGLVTGSIRHDAWKTGIRLHMGKNGELSSWSVFGGITSVQTRDTLPHGHLYGKKIVSPMIFLGFYDDYRDGLEEYGKANTLIVPSLEWKKGVPMGWNSWSAVGDKISYDIYVNSSDFIKDFLQDNSFSQDGVVYINFDSFWDNLSEQQLRQAVRHVVNNGQIPGTYFTPFTYWGGTHMCDTIANMSGGYRWEEMLLKDKEGKILPIYDGGFSLDATHPGTINRNRNMIKKICNLGFRYIKLDFLSHGAVEGVFFSKGVTTGIQAYNYGMQQLLHNINEYCNGEDFFISLSIAPIFPSQYAHSRRISCDVFGTIDSTEYMLNSLTYGWWMNQTIYPYNDPDHIVLYNNYNHSAPILFNEGLSRYISAAIAGTVMLDSSDYRIEGARERARQILTHSAINDIAKEGRSFRPVEGNTGDRACDCFVKKQEGEAFLACFNFSETKGKPMAINLERIGLGKNETYDVIDLWNGTEWQVQGDLLIYLEPAQPMLMKLSRAC